MTLMWAAQWESPDPGPLSRHPLLCLLLSPDVLGDRLSGCVLWLSLSCFLTLTLHPSGSSLCKRGREEICMECGRPIVAPDAMGIRKASPGWELNGWRIKQREGSEEPAQGLGTHGAGVWRMRGAGSPELRRVQQPCTAHAQAPFTFSRGARLSRGLQQLLLLMLSVG